MLHNEFVNDTVAVTGMGVITPIGIGLNSFTNALKEGKSNFSVIEFNQDGHLFKFPAAKVNTYNYKDLIAEVNLNKVTTNNAKRLRNVSTSTTYGVYCALEAWADAGLEDADIDLTRVAIVSGGTNTQQASSQTIRNEYREKLQFMNPTYALNFFDTDIVGVLSELLGIKGEGHAIGAASASGNMALIQGHRLISSKEYDIVVIVAPLMDISIYEYQGFTTLGAMATIQDGVRAEEICKPFDIEHNGFVYGQSAGCFILESKEHVSKRSKQPYGSIAGYGIGMDSNRNPNPSVAGEIKAMQQAMLRAGILPRQVSYVNTHGTASKIGDKTEVDALLAVGLEGVKANSTKSLIGHGLSAAGLVEGIASLIQMKDEFLHPSLNLENPISNQIDWVIGETKGMHINYAMNNSFGFGGINTSVILKK